MIIDMCSGGVTKRTVQNMIDRAVFEAGTCTPESVQAQIDASLEEHTIPMYAEIGKLKGIVCLGEYNSKPDGSITIMTALYDNLYSLVPYPDTYNCYYNDVLLEYRGVVLTGCTYCKDTKVISIRYLVWDVNNNTFRSETWLINPDGTSTRA